MLGIHGTLDAHIPTNPALIAMEQAAQGFTITVTPLTGPALLDFHIKACRIAVRAISETDYSGASQSSLTLHSHSILKEAELVDDFCHLQDITDTNELHLEFVLQKEEDPRPVKS